MVFAGKYILRVDLDGVHPYRYRDRRLDAAMAEARRRSGISRTFIALHRPLVAAR